MHDVRLAGKFVNNLSADISFAAIVPTWVSAKLLSVDTSRQTLIEIHIFIHFSLHSILKSVLPCGIEDDSKKHLRRIKNAPASPRIINSSGPVHITIVHSGFASPVRSWEEGIE